MTTPTRPTRGATDFDIVQAALATDYELLEELGRGGMATVYRARERMLDREVAIKVLPFALAFDQSFVERFLREARTSARLEHPHIIPIHRVGQAGQVTYFVMKLLRGQSLSDRLRDHGPLSAGETGRVLIEAASALGYAHSHGVVHRDVKPDNILLDEDGRCVVTDFGIARSGSDSKLTATGTSVGTPRYMSPEQARARDVDGRSDLYSLGVVGYECLTGHPPFDGGDAFAILMEHINAPVPTPELATPEARSLFAVIERMLEKQPEDRFTDAASLLAAIRDRTSTERSRSRTSSTAPHAETVATGPLYGTLHSGPRSAAALDRALDAGFEMLKQQRPKVVAGLAAGRRVVESNVPRVRDSVRGAVESNAPRLRDLARRIDDALAPLRARVLERPRRTIGGAAGIALLSVGAYYGAHFAIMHRSRCPSVAAGSTSGPGSDSGTRAAKTRPFSLLVDDAGSIRRGGDADVYYDVCGLDGDATFTTRVTIARNESGLNRLLGRSVSPVTAHYEESASGPSERRHRTLDMDDMPAGSYWISVGVTDARGRRREEGTTLRVRGE